jgi:hypothetical protein
MSDAARQSQSCGSRFYLFIHTTANVHISVRLIEAHRGLPCAAERHFQGSGQEREGTARPSVSSSRGYEGNRSYPTGPDTPKD